MVHLIEIEVFHSQAFGLMTKARTNAPSTRLLVELLKRFVSVPASVFGYVVGGPLHLALEYLSRKNCPRCSKKNLRGVLIKEKGCRPYHFGICSSCQSQYKYMDGKWEYLGQVEEPGKRRAP